MLLSSLPLLLCFSLVTNALMYYLEAFVAGGQAYTYM